MYEIEFEYADQMSNWEWRRQKCSVSSVDECIRIYGLKESGIIYRILSVKEVKG